MEQIGAGPSLTNQMDDVQIVLPILMGPTQYRSTSGAPRRSSPPGSSNAAAQWAVCRMHLGVGHGIWVRWIGD